MIEPVEGYLIIEVIKPSDQAGAGGIRKVQTTNSVPEKGIIVEGSFDVRTQELAPGKTIRAGATVYFKKWAGEDVEYEGKKYKIIQKKEIIAYEE